VVDRVVADFALDSGWTSEVLELGEEAVDWCVANDGLNAGDQCAGGLSWYGKRRDSVQKPDCFGSPPEGRNVTESPHRRWVV
jgi:hypothetical protein